MICAHPNFTTVHQVMKTPLFRFFLIISLSMTGCLATPTHPTPTATSTLTPTLTETLTSTMVWFPPTATTTPFLTFTPPPPTPDQRPGIGEILFRDDFSDPTVWSLAASNNTSAAFGNHELTIAISSPKMYLFSLRAEPLLDDFYAEITASPTLCRGLDEYGLLLRVSTAADYYRFSISCDGQVRMDRLAGGQASSPQPWMPGALVPVGAPSNSRLAIWAVGKEMRFFINDQYQFSVRDPLLTRGTIGVFARSAGDSAVTVSFSELIVYTVIK